MEAFFLLLIVAATGLISYGVFSWAIDIHGEARKTAEGVAELVQATKEKTMLRKLLDADGLPVRCDHPEHDPPPRGCLQPGMYEYTCPKCERTEVFVVPPMSFGGGPWVPPDIRPATTTTDGDPDVKPSETGGDPWLDHDGSR